MSALVTLAVIALLWWGLDRWHATATTRQEQYDAAERERQDRALRALVEGRWR